MNYCGNLNGVYGVKTGFTNGANRCLVTATKRGNMDIICVVLGADTKKDRTQDSIKLIEYAFNNYEMVNIKEKIDNEYKEWKTENEKNIVVNKGIYDKVETRLEDYDLIMYPVNKEEIKDIEIQINNINYFESPMFAGQTVGVLEVKIDGEIIYSVNIVTEKEIRKKDATDYFVELIRKIFV